MHPLVLRSVAIAVMLALGAGCGSTPKVQSATVATPSPDHESAKGSGLGALESPEHWCTAHPEVSCVETEGRVGGFVVPTPGRSRGLVLLDPGGPGLTLPDQNAPVGGLLPRGIRGHDVLVVVEPWLSSPPSEDCQRSAYDGPPGPTCPLREWQSDAAGLSQVVRRAEAMTGEVLVGAFLESFGATRSAVLASAAQRPRSLRWAVLQSPAPPPGTSAGSLVAARRGAVLDLLAEPCGDDASRADAVRDEATRLVIEGKEPEAIGRELALGLIALTSMLPDNDTFIARLAPLLQRQRVTMRDIAVLRQLGRRFKRRASERVDPSMFAFWADVCSR